MSLDARLTRIAEQAALAVVGRHLGTAAPDPQQVQQVAELREHLQCTAAALARLEERVAVLERLAGPGPAEPAAEPAPRRAPRRRSEA